MVKRGLAAVIMALGLMLGAGTVQAAEPVAGAAEESEAELTVAYDYKATMYDVFLAEYWREDESFNKWMLLDGNHPEYGTMPYRSIVNGLEGSKTFTSALDRWEMTMFVFGDTGEIYERKDFYDRVVYSVIFDYYEDKLSGDVSQLEEHIESCYTNLVMELSVFVEAKYDVTLSEYIESLDFMAETMEQSQKIIDLISELQGQETFESVSQSDMLKFLKACDTLEDFMNKTAVVMYLNKTNGEISDVLRKAALFTEDEDLQKSLNNMADCCNSDSMWDMYFSIYSGTTGVDALCAWSVDLLKDGVGVFLPLKAGMITADVFDSMMDSCFSHNATLETFYYMRILCELEDALRGAYGYYNQIYENAVGANNTASMPRAGKQYCQTVYLLNCVFVRGLATSADYMKVTAVDNPVEKFMYDIFGWDDSNNEESYLAFEAGIRMRQQDILNLVKLGKHNATRKYASYLRGLAEESDSKAYESLTDYCDLAPEEYIYEGEDPEEDLQEVQEYFRYYSNLRIRKEVVVASDVTVGGNVIVDSGYLSIAYGSTMTVAGDVDINGGRIYLGDSFADGYYGKLIVDGDFRIGDMGETDEETGYRLATSTGTFEMYDNESEIVVGGDFIVCSNKRMYNYKGTLTIGGDFCQYGNYNAYDSDDYARSHNFYFWEDARVIFTDDAPHSIYFESYSDSFYGLGKAHLGNGEIECLTPVSYYMIQDAELNLKSSDTTIDIKVGDYDLTINGDVNFLYGGFTVEKGSVHVKGNLSLGNKGETDPDTGYRFATSRAGISTFNQYGGQPHTGELLVDGDVTVCSTADSHWYGKMTIGGDFYQYGTCEEYSELYASGESFWTGYYSEYYNNTTDSTIVIFTDDKPHTVYFESPLSGFVHVDFGSNVITPLSGIRWMRLYGDANWDLSQLGGNFAVNAQEYEVVDGQFVENAGLDLNGYTLTILGDMNLTAGNICVNGGCLNVKGDLSVGLPGEIEESTGYRMATSTGRIIMENAADKVITEGDFTTCSSTENRVKAGTLYVGGDFNQYGSYVDDCEEDTVYASRLSFEGNYFEDEDPASLVVFADDAPHKIHFDSCTSTFYHVHFGNGELDLSDGISGFVLYEDMEWNLSSEDVAVLCGYDYYMRGLDLNGYTLTVNSDLNLTSGNINLNGGTLHVKGDFSIGKKGEIDERTGYRLATSSGAISTDSDEDVLIVEGDFETCTSQANYISSGTFYIKGDFAQYGISNFQDEYWASEYSFYTGGYNNTVVLCGTEPQSVYFESDACCFSTLKCTNLMSSYTFSPEECWYILIDNEFKVTYELNGGVNAESNKDAYLISNEVIPLAAPTRAGYTFAGWYANYNWSEPITAIPAGNEEDFYLYAEWTEGEAEPTAAPTAEPTVTPTVAPTAEPTPTPDVPEKNWSDDYTGLYMDENQDWWYIENGEVNLSYTGLAFVNEKWWCVISGRIDFSYHGFLDANGASWYIVGGEVAFDYNGLACVNDEWFYIVGGRLDSGYNGMAYVNDAWWYVVNGKVDFSFTGLTYVNEKWWYVNAGRIDFTYHGICEFGGVTYYIKNGEINYEAEGLVCVGADWYFVENGCVRTDYSGMLFVNDAWWYVVNGKIDFQFSGLFLFNGDYWFVSQGKIVLGYIGLVFYDDQWWYLENGVVNFDYNGFAYVNDIWWWVEDGLIDFNHTGIHQFNGIWWYVSGAQIDFSYNGTVIGEDGNTYEVVNGEVLNYA